MKHVWMVLVLATTLAGCAVGIQPDGSSPSVSYTVPRDYQTVYLRAQNQASECLRGQSSFEVRSEVDPVAQTGRVSVVDPLTDIEVARTSVKAQDARNTQVEQVVWGRGSWDLNALHAMRESIILDDSVCFAYK